MIKGLTIDKTTAALYEMLSDTVWQTVVEQRVPGELYETQLFVQIDPAYAALSTEEKYIDAMMRYFKEGMEKMEVAAMQLVPNLQVYPTMQVVVETLTERYITDTVQRHPRYAPFMEPPGVATDDVFDGKKVVFVRVYFSIVQKDPRVPPVLMWTTVADAMARDYAQGEGMYTYVKTIDCEFPL